MQNISKTKRKDGSYKNGDDKNEKGRKPEKGEAAAVKLLFIAIKRCRTEKREKKDKEERRTFLFHVVAACCYEGLNCTKKKLEHEHNAGIPFIVLHKFLCLYVDKADKIKPYLKHNFIEFCFYTSSHICPN